MMKTVKKMTLAAFVLPLVLGAGTVMAAGGKAKGADAGDDTCGPGGERAMFEQLNLTAEQQAKLRDLHEQNRQQMKAAREKGPSGDMTLLREQERAMMLAPNFDKAAATELAQKMSAQQVERRVQMMEKRHQMMSVLTPEQKTQYQALQQERLTQCRKEGVHGAHRGY